MGNSQPFKATLGRVVTRSNGQPALVADAPRPSGRLELHPCQVLDVTVHGVRRRTVLHDEALLARLAEPTAPTAAA